MAAEGLGVIVGLHGKMGAGKNEAAKRLALLASVPVVEVSYAAKLKQSAAALLGCTVADLEVWKNCPAMTVYVWDREEGECGERSIQSVRQFLQRYGTEAHRDVFGADFWLDAALPLGGSYAGSLYIVTDVRFGNEAKRIRDLGGLVVGIVGPEQDTGSHASERPIECDRWINNELRNDGYALLDSELATILSPMGLLRRDAA